MFGVLVRVLIIYTIFISILCVPWEEFSVTESSQQICDFCKGVILKSKDSVEICEVSFWYQELFIK